MLLAILIEPYRMQRLTGFLNPTGDPSGAGFQAIQAKIALGSGGIFGVGLGQSLQKAFYLPEAHTDMIAAVIGEELGLRRASRRSWGCSASSATPGCGPPSGHATATRSCSPRG